MRAHRGFQKGLPLSPRPHCHLLLQDRGTTLLGLPAQPFGASPPLCSQGCTLGRPCLCTQTEQFLQQPGPRGGGGGVVGTSKHVRCGRGQGSNGEWSFLEQSLCKWSLVNTFPWRLSRPRWKYGRGSGVKARVSLFNSLAVRTGGAWEGAAGGVSDELISLPFPTVTRPLFPGVTKACYTSGRAWSHGGT